MSSLASTTDSAKNTPVIRPIYMNSIGADGRIMLGTDVEILTDKPLEELASYGTYAFEARDRRISGEKLALICGRGMGPRATALAAYRNIKSPYIVKLVDAGIIDWAPENRQRLALVFDMPPKRKLLTNAEAQPHRIPEDKIITVLIQPILNVLSEFRNVDLVHGAINPENIFLAGAEGSESAILGECVSSAPSFRQHALFEPIERAMAQPAGRGIGTIKDDLYALGMCVAMALRGENFLRGKTAEDVLQAKMNDGSFSVAIHQQRLPTNVAEFLRGVLNDDEQQRWDMDDANRWLSGQRQTQKQGRPVLNAARPFLIKNEKFWNLRSLAYMFSKNVTDAIGVLEDSQFDLWVKRNFEDKNLLKNLSSVWENEKSSGRDKLVASMGIVLDPPAPVRYKGLAVLPSGFGTSLAEAISRGEDIQAYGEMILNQFFNAWVNARFEEIPDGAGIVSLFEKTRGFLTQKTAGYGIERVLYTLNRDTACLSPVLKDFFVLSPDGLLMALETISRQASRPESVFDRHMIAFLSVRESKMIDPFLGHITSPDKGNQVVGIIRALSAIQRRFKLGPVPGVSAWLASMAPPAVDRFYDRDLRKEIAKRIERAKDTGILSDLLDLVDDYAALEQDTQRFTLAKREFAYLQNEKAMIEKQLKQKKGLGYGTGRQTAMIVSCLLSFFIIIGYVISQFSRIMN